MTDFHHKEIDNDLIHYATMPVEALAQITDEALADYQEDFEAFAEDQKEDVQKGSEIAQRVMTDIKTLFGTYSKQHKYLERNIRGHEDVVTAHGRKYPQPHDIQRKVEQARKCFDVTTLHASSISSGVDEITMEQQNEAIAYLLGNDFSFGSDFTAYNAHEIAMSHGFEKVVSISDNKDIHFELREGVDKCGECETKSITFSARQYIDNGVVSCECGCEDYKGKLTLNGTDIKIMVGAENG